MDKAGCGLFYYNYYLQHSDFMTRPPAKRAYSVGVVILAAGSSSRMGRPKLLLRWGRTSVLGHLIEQWKRLGAGQIVVVCPSDQSDSSDLLPSIHQTIQTELHRLRFPAHDRILNPTPELGMFSSIKCAARWPGWRPELTHWAIVLGDQPHLRRQTLRDVLDFSAAHSNRICQPARHGHGRHPVLLPRPILRQLVSSRAKTLKSFLLARTGRVALCELDDPGLDLDIDRPADYKRAVIFAQRHSKLEQPNREGR